MNRWPFHTGLGQTSPVPTCPPGQLYDFTSGQCMPPPTCPPGQYAIGNVCVQPCPPSVAGGSSGQPCGGGAFTPQCPPGAQYDQYGNLCPGYMPTPPPPLPLPHPILRPPYVITTMPSPQPQQTTLQSLFGGNTGLLIIGGLVLILLARK
ncbi:MAG: hypothetical protein J2P41_00230 [Blastocatellia bacterium]|nr:hypothetical protein [Blastocatellia bacterium]